MDGWIHDLWFLYLISSVESAPEQGCLLYSSLLPYSLAARMFCLGMELLQIKGYLSLGTSGSLL
jgi:hypothetical protein